MSKRLVLEAKTGPEAPLPSTSGWHKLTSHLVGSILSFLAIEVKVDPWERRDSRMKATVDWSESQYPAISKSAARLYESINEKQRFMETHLKVVASTKFLVHVCNTLERFAAKFKGLKTLEVDISKPTDCKSNGLCRLNGLLNCYRMKISGNGGDIIQSWSWPPHLLVVDIERWESWAPRKFLNISWCLHNNYLNLVRSATVEGEGVQKVIPRPLLCGFEINECKRCNVKFQWLPKCDTTDCYMNELDYCYDCLNVGKYTLRTDGMKVVQHHMHSPRAIGFKPGQRYNNFVEEHNAKISCIKLLECAKCKLEEQAEEYQDPGYVPTLAVHACLESQERPGTYSLHCWRHMEFCGMCVFRMCSRCTSEGGSICKSCQYKVLNRV